MLRLGGNAAQHPALVVRSPFRSTGELLMTVSQTQRPKRGRQVWKHLLPLSKLSRATLCVSMLLQLAAVSLSAQSMGGMNTTTHRWVLPLFAVGGTWDTTLHLRNSSSNAMGVSMLFRDMNGVSVRRLHQNVESQSVIDLSFAKILMRLDPKAELLLGSVIIVQEDSMVSPTLSGIADLRSELNGLPHLRSQESLNQLHDVLPSIWVGVYPQSTSDDTTVVTSVIQTVQTISVECSAETGPIKSLQFKLEPHHTVALQNCALQADTSSTLKKQHPGNNLTLKITLSGSEPSGFSVYGFQLDEGTHIKFTPSAAM